MRKRTVAACAVALLAASCTSSSRHSVFRPDHTSTPTSKPVPVSSPAPTTSSSPAVDGKGTKIGFILPDESTRWATAEPAAIDTACSAAHLNCDVQNARGDPATMRSLAQDMQSNGVRILVLVAVAPRAGAAVERDARRNGVLTVEYTVHVPDSTAAAFVTFAAAAAGAVMGRALPQCPQTAGRSSVDYARIDAPPGDPARALRAGYRRVLATTPGWNLAATRTASDAAQARAATRQLLTAYPHLRALVAADDALAAGAAAVLAARHLEGRVALSGSGTTAGGVQQVLRGAQCFTVYDPPEAAAAVLAHTLVRLVDYETVPGTRSVSGAGGRRVPVVLVQGARLVTKSGIKAVIDDGYVSRGAVCAGSYAALCTAAGI